MPVIEAAACGVVPLAVDYSAMSSVIRECNGFPIDVAGLRTETETGRYMAIPDINHTIRTLNTVINKTESLGYVSHESCIQNFNWDSTANVWSECIDSVGFGDWNRPPQIYHIPEFNVGEGMTNMEYVHWLYSEVLKRPDLKNSYNAQKMASDLNMAREPIQPGVPRDYQHLNREMAYNRIAAKANYRNEWEQERLQYVH